ncbi:DNA/RNA non-specific endonuclease [Phormidium sp. CCY1219]|uniref:DNA/RNA non-specific endonuclease n=1 Tax=Phormidium sp. CCY1219 TaxID=2886104 RepID=UPI002D1F1BD0|nr:DNA/RNA non-specific endonuclease [Phormidium sp. CCY1219]MEB3827891.1 DNA/RNA non-specific endonuclease [Phormidium sp. CCY1219]
MTWQQVDTNSETPEIDPIALPAGASPQSIALDPGDNYAYIADGKIGALYILDINPNSATYHQIIQTISFPSASWGLRQISMSSDGRKLFVAAPDYSLPFSNTKGQIHVVNIDPRDRPSNLENNPRLWHEKIGFISTYSQVDGVFATNNGGIAFTNSRRENEGFGVVEILNDDPLDFTVGTPRYASLRLGNFLDYFDINWATSVDILRDGSYAFVAAKNNSSQTGVESIDGPRAGSNIGIIKDPFGPNPKLVAATRPIPGGKTTDLVLSSDEKYLYVSYPGLELSDSTDRGGIFVFDVEEMIATVENPGNFWLDSLNRGIGSVGFNENAKRLASENDLGSVPIDDINPDISVAADYEIIGGNWRSDFTFGVPEDTIKAPLGIGGMPMGLTLVSASKPLQLVSPGISGVADSLTPTFEWKFGDEDDDDVCGAIDPDDVKEVRLYVSVFPKGEGLLPGDRWNEIQYPGNLDDYNPNRVLTATWKEGVWTWNGGSQAGAKDQFTLPDDRMLTAGQEYHWAVEAVTTEGEIGRTVTGRFETALSESFNDGRFSSVTVLTRGVEPDNSGESINSQINALASNIQEAGGSVMKYNPSTGGWQSVTLNGNSWVVTNATPIPGQPLVLLADWMQGLDASSFYNAGFAEAAADSLFASLVKLDQQYGGKVGEGSGLYDANGNLIRTQGDIFNSPLHFIGLGQGAVVNTEIIQRLGTYFPHAGGTNASNRDLQMTTIDPYDYDPTFPEPVFSTVLDPEVVVWDNVTYADNYYQNKGTDNTLNGKELSTADWNVNLGSWANFDQNLDTGGPHQAAAAWYAGTADLNLSQIPSENGQTIYRRLGDLSSSERPWYTPDHTNANFSHGEEMAPWEGIGTGWFHSVLGGGNQLRPYNYEGGKLSKDEIQEFSYPNDGWGEYLKTKRVSVEQENNPIPGMRGDFAVPTLFNGNFDAIVYKYSSQNIPSWYIDTPTNPLKQSALIDVAGIPGSTGLPNYALQLGGGNPTQATHDWFMVPDWGNLRFDVFAPVESGELNVKLETIEGQSKNVTIALDRDADFLIDETNSREIPIVKEIYSEIENQIGFGRKGFETFQLKLHLSDSEIAEFRGKPAKISFSLQGGDFVYIDNVFFKSDFLAIANPTEARWNLESSTSVNNLLLEKPQYALSYNADTKLANWVGWKVDKTWVTQPQPEPGEFPTGLLRRPEFIADPDLLASGLSSYDANIFTGLGMDRGHLAPDRDKRRHPKDQLSTYLTTNLIAQSMDNNRFFVSGSDNPRDASAWFNIEDKVVFPRAAQGEELYIFAGAFGNNDNSQPRTNVPELLNLNVNRGNTNPDNLVSQEIHIPKWTWKSIIALEQPGADITSSNIEGFAYITPNRAEPDWNNVSSEGIANPLNVFSQFLNNNRGNITNPTDWRNPDTWRVTIPELTHILNERNRVRDYDFNFDFLSNLPETIQQTLNS